VNATADQRTSDLDCLRIAEDLKALGKPSLPPAFAQMVKAVRAFAVDYRTLF
jgi:hypothetical protein